MSSRTSKKRTGEGSADVPSSKKTRFVEPADDPVNFAEEVDAQLENPSAQRKGRVKTEGYDSDSSDDGEGVVLSRKPGADGAAEDEDEDMFAIGDNEEKEEAGSHKKKKEEYLRLGDIEGQEFGDRSGSEGAESDEDDEPEDEDEAERRKKTGMGFELSSFNMREEMEEGKFAADGTYVRTFDPHAVHDRWLDEVDEKEIKKARRIHKQREREQREKMKAEELELQQSGGKSELEKQLVGMLKKGETVLEALQRLGSKSKKAAPKHKKASHLKQGDLEEVVMEVEKPSKAPSDIDHITHLASSLMSLGDTDIYSRTYEELVRSVRSAGRVDESWIPPSADVKYEYKWDVPGAGDNVFGPFSEEDMKVWHSATYFGPAGEKVMVRKVGGEWGSWSDVVTI